MSDSFVGFVVWHDDKLLTKKKFWAHKEYTKGWVWSFDEVQEIIAESKEWQFKPTYYQAAYVQNGDTIIYGAPQKITQE